MFNKKYKIIYYQGDRSKPEYLFQLSKSGKKDGVRIYFWNDGKKHWQDKWKNDFINEIDKEWRSNSKNWYCRNWKKNKTQGIEILFK